MAALRMVKWAGAVFLSAMTGKQWMLSFEETYIQNLHTKVEGYTQYMVLELITHSEAWLVFGNEAWKRTGESSVGISPFSGCGWALLQVKRKELHWGHCMGWSGTQSPGFDSCLGNLKGSMLQCTSKGEVSTGHRSGDCQGRWLVSAAGGPERRHVMWGRASVWIYLNPT